MIVSNIAGTTRDAIDTEVRRNGKDYIFIDTADCAGRTKSKKNWSATALSVR